MCDREIQAHVEEPFWYIYVAYASPAENAKCEFDWSRHRLFDKFAAEMLFSLCADTKEATVTKVRPAAIPGFKSSLISADGFKSEKEKGPVSTQHPGTSERSDICIEDSWRTNHEVC